MGKRKIVLFLIVLLTVLALAFIMFVKPKFSFEMVSINQSEWNKIISSKEENNNIKLDSIRFNDYPLIVDEKNSTIYYSVINESANKYTPTVAYSTPSKMYKLAVLADEINEDRVSNNYIYKVMLYGDIDYKVYDLKCTTMPVLNVTIKENNSKNKEQAIVFLFDNLSNSSKRITISEGKIEKNKEKYIVTLNVKSPGKNIRKNNISILSMAKDNKFILVPVNLESLGEANKEEFDPEKMEFNIELFINSEYQGLYTIKRK